MRTTYLLKNRNDERFRKKEDIEILKNNYLGHLVYISNGRPRVKPITYYYDQTHNSIICYSAEDHKISAMRKNNKISLEVEEIKSTDNWRSVIVNGEFEELHGTDAKSLLHQFTLGVKTIVNRKEKKTFILLKNFRANYLQTVSQLYIESTSLKLQENKENPNVIIKVGLTTKRF